MFFRAEREPQLHGGSLASAFDFQAAIELSRSMTHVLNAIAWLGSLALAGAIVGDSDGDSLTPGLIAARLGGSSDPRKGPGAGAPRCGHEP